MFLRPTLCGPLGLPVDTIIQNTVDDYGPPRSEPQAPCRFEALALI